MLNAPRTIVRWGCCGTGLLYSKGKPCNGPNPRPPIIALVMVTDQPLDDDLSVLILKGTIDHSPPPVIGAAIVEHANFTRASEEPLGPLKTCPELLERDPIHVCR